MVNVFRVYVALNEIKPIQTPTTKDVHQIWYAKITIVKMTVSVIWLPTMAKDLWVDVETINAVFHVLQQPDKDNAVQMNETQTVAVPEPIFAYVPLSTLQ